MTGGSDQANVSLLGLALGFFGALVAQVVKSPSSAPGWVLYIVSLFCLVLGGLVLSGMIGQMLGLKRPHPLAEYKRRKLASRQVGRFRRVLEEFNSLLRYEGASGRRMSLAPASEILRKNYLAVVKGGGSSTDTRTSEYVDEINQMVEKMKNEHEWVRVWHDSIFDLFNASGSSHFAPDFQKEFYVSLTKCVQAYARTGELFDGFHSRMGEVSLPRSDKRRISSLVTRYNGFMKSYETFVNNFPEQIASYGFEPIYMTPPRLTER